MSVEDRDFAANLSDKKDMLEIPRDSKNRRRTKSPEREQRQPPADAPHTKETKQPRTSNVTHMLSTHCDENSPGIRGKEGGSDPLLLDRSLKTNHDQPAPKRFQSFKANDKNLETSSSGSYNDEQRDSISNLQEDADLIYKGTSFDQIFKQSFIRSHSRTANLKKNRSMSGELKPGF